MGNPKPGVKCQSIERRLSRIPFNVIARRKGEVDRVVIVGVSRISFNVIARRKGEVDIVVIVGAKIFV